MSKTILTSTYQQIANGAQTVQFQVLRGFVEIAETQSQPAADYAGFRGSIEDKIITITPPTRAWIRANSGATADIKIMVVA